MKRFTWLMALMLLSVGCGARTDLPDPARPRRSDGPPTHIYVLDSADGHANGGRINRFDDMAGSGWTRFQKAEPPFFAVCGPALDDGERIYFARNSPPGVTRVDDMGGFGEITFAQEGTGAGQFLGVGGVAIDTLNRIYVVDAGANRVVRIDDMTGTGWVSFGGPAPGSGTGQLDQPTGIAVSPQGKILISDSRNQRIVQIDDMTGAGWATWDMPVHPTDVLSWPSSVAYDQQERIYAVDFQASVLHRLDSIAGDGHVAFSSNDLIQMGHVYVHPSGRIFLSMLNFNMNVASMDDMTGAGLRTFAGPGNGVRFQSPVESWRGERAGGAARARALAG